MKENDAAYQEACFRAYNDWVYDYCSKDLNRLYGIAMISLFNIDHAVKELRRCKKLGLCGAMIWGSPPEELAFENKLYEPFWAEASNLGMPLSLHIGTGGDVSAREKAISKTPFWSKLDSMVQLPAEIQRSLFTLIFSGVLERFPKLRIVSAEYDIGWVPYFLQNIDRLYQRWSPLIGLKLTLPPSDYFQRQVQLTFIRDNIGVKMVKAGLLPAKNVMWCDDYPHGASTWPKSQEFVDETMRELPFSDRTKIVRENAINLYRMSLST